MEWVSDGIVTAAAFQFDESPKHVKNGWMAQSIWWEDHETVVDIMFQHKKDNEFQFKVGVARMPRESLHYLNRLMALKNIISYDREPTNDIPYHGNLLLSVKSKSAQRKLAAANFASHVSDFIPRPE